MKSKLEEFRTLPAGWDSYSAPTPSGVAVEHAESFLEALVWANVTPSRVAPSVIGGIGITIRREERRAYVEFQNDGQIHAVFTDPQTELITKPVAADMCEYRRIATEIRQFHEDSAAQ